MTAEGPHAGLTHSRFLIVDPRVIVPVLTPAHRLAAECMVGFVEATCIDALKPFLGRAEDRGHPCRSQPCGGDAHGHAGDRPGELAVVEGRNLRSKLECQDEKEIIGTGFN